MECTTLNCLYFYLMTGYIFSHVPNFFYVSQDSNLLNRKYADSQGLLSKVTFLFLYIVLFHVCPQLREEAAEMAIKLETLESEMKDRQ